jgi:hypothetical protein
VNAPAIGSHGGAPLPDRVDAALSRHWIFYAAAVMLFQALLIFRHEPWLDEWQALQIAVQSPDLAELFLNLRYEGHPPFWYLVLRPMAALVGPDQALAVSALIFALGTQYLILFRSPFPRWVRLCIGLSEVVLFEFNTISRGYTAGLFLTFLCLTWWRRPRLVWVPLALLPSVEFFFGVFSAIFIALRWRERALWLPGLGVWLAVSLASAWSILPASDNIPAFPPPDAFTESLRYLFQLSVVAVPLGWNEGLQWNALTPAYSYFVLWIFFLVVCLDETRHRPWHRAALAAFFVLQLGFYAFV